MRAFCRVYQTSLLFLIVAGTTAPALAQERYVGGVGITEIGQMTVAQAAEHFRGLAVAESVEFRGRAGGFDGRRVLGGLQNRVRLHRPVFPWISRIIHVFDLVLGWRAEFREKRLDLAQEWANVVFELFDYDRPMSDRSRIL